MPRESLRSGSFVSFRLGDATCPAFAQISREMSPEVTVCGEVTFFSDCGDDPNHFAIINVDGMPRPLIVPVAKLSPLQYGGLRDSSLPDRPHREQREAG